jgi:hypothetical protein
MNKYLVLVISLCLLSLGIPGTFAASSSTTSTEISPSTLYALQSTTSSLQQMAESYLSLKGDEFTTYKEGPQPIDLPWMNRGGDFLEWVIRITYNGQSFEQEVPIDVTDFSERFLKHPEYGEILKFNVDDDAADDIEVKIGFYWSLIDHPNGEIIKSLETRFQVRQLEEGGYIADADGELEVWSELHVNYGLVKSNARPFSLDATEKSGLQSLMERLFIKIDQSPLLSRFTKLRNVVSQWILQNDDEEPVPQVADNDYFSVGVGYRSPEGVDIPRYSEKRFAFARDNIFSPTIYQHMMDPGPSKGKTPMDLLYGFRSYKEGDSIDNPTYDIAFEVSFEPSVYLKTKFIPLGGYVYYYFDQTSQRQNDTKITFSSNILKGSGNGIELSLIFDAIDSTLGRTGQWMSFDVDTNIFGRGDLLGFHYAASDTFTVSVVVNAPVFEEKIKMKGIPKRVDFGWDVDVDLAVLPGTIDVAFGGALELDMSSNIEDIIVYYPRFEAGAEETEFLRASDLPRYQKLSAEASLYLHNGDLLTVTPSGYVDLTMSSDLGAVNVYYPATDTVEAGTAFLSIPRGIPSSSRLSAEATVHVDLDNLLNPSNYVYGEIEHDCSSNFDELSVYIPGMSLPLMSITDVPSYSVARGQLYWSRLQGYAYAWRGSSGPPDPIAINIEYGGLALSNVLQIRDGYVTTGFKIAEDGYFRFDTSKNIFGNTLQVSNADTGDAVALSVDEVSADNLHADWNIDTSGEQIRFRGLRFGGFVDTLKNFHLDVNYKGKRGGLALDWTLGEQGSFAIELEQPNEIQLDFSDFLQNSTQFNIDGQIVISQTLNFDMSWRLKKGDSASDPGYFRINYYSDDANVKEFDLYFTCNDQYGIDISFDNLQLYLNLQWYIKTTPLIHPYIWLDYNLGFGNFNGQLLWDYDNDPSTQNWWTIPL